ncbi:MAG: 2-succinyl-5-enolpyruvyl-6-hydroxy-3-cyclohexene-1-carboxylic-acid synthase [Opitutaceae bacterium]|nr:2-succinyl-5-enolpyruvyl-6-hydroxy-3-cyclohexene-1-carboxylic-acid synthase [Opitutaceae bacterium]
MPEDSAYLNHVWSRTIVETLLAKGLRYAVICPGSRSSPLTLAFARTLGIESIPVLDERSAGFFALGMAKREGKPVAIVCTSGTAAVNLYPAVVEAKECGVPLIVLTADRPHELRDCRAGQTIDQVKLYGSCPVHQLEFSTPRDSEESLRYACSSMATLWERSMGPRMGPVHANLPFREPLVSEKTIEGAEANPLSDWIEKHARLSEYAVPPLQSAIDLEEFADSRKGVILIGSPLSPVSKEWIKNVAEFTSRLNWPVLADALSPIRNYAESFPNLICGYNYICGAMEIDSELAPNRAIVIGDLPIGKRLRTWFKASTMEAVFLTPFPGDFDAGHNLSVSRCFDFSMGIPKCQDRDDSSFADLWLDKEQIAKAETGLMLESCDSLFEGAVATVLSREIEKDAAVFVSNSLPPRDMEFYWEPNNSRAQIYSSRGANGIDGILSTALGVAHRGAPTYLVTGDLALLHDTNGALIARELKGAITIILLNNQGGGIFDMLPVSQFEDEFERFFATDQQIEFRDWARTYQISHTHADTLSDFRECLKSEHKEGVRIIELRFDRKRDALRRKQWFRDIVDMLGSA